MSSDVGGGGGVVVVSAWVVVSSTTTTKTTTRTKHSFAAATTLRAKRNRQRGDDDDSLKNRWYEAVDENATPDDVFWEEMERQKIMTADDPPPSAAFATTASVVAFNIQTINQGTASSSSSSSSGNANNYNSPSPPLTPKSIEAALSEYELFAVSDNWLDDDLTEIMRENDDDDYDDEDFHKGAPSLDDQLDHWANEDDDDDNDGTGSTNTWEVLGDEPWDQWGETVSSSKYVGEEEGGSVVVDNDDDVPGKNSDRSTSSSSTGRRNTLSDFLSNQRDDGDNEQVLDDDSEDGEGLEEEADERRLAKLTVTSQRLERARNNPKAVAFFQRDPDTTEGLDQMWVSAIDNVCFKNLVGTFRNYGIQFADNFGDWQDGSIQDGLASIEDMASFKARQVFAVTGLPCIASRTSFEIEPIPDFSSRTAVTSPATPYQRSAAAIFSNPRVVTGYRFNDIGMHVDYICDALRPVSEPDRVTSFKTCLCYYDGEMEIFDYGTCDVDLHFANSMRTFIPVAQAINEMMKTLELTFGLVYQKWLVTRMKEVLSSGYGTGNASVKLRDRVLKDGRVLPNDIIDVSAFMDSMVDVNLMDECANELSQRFVKEKPTKILTVATTGLVLALPMAKYLQVPVVYARKERNVVMADTYIAAYSSKTVGKNRELLVSKSHLEEHDRVLIVDDFLSSGSSQEALLRIISQAGATAVGVGVLLEKVYDSGRQSLSGFDIPIHSLCRIASVRSGVIQLMEEEGFNRMQQQQQQLQKQLKHQTKKDDIDQQ